MHSILFYFYLDCPRPGKSDRCVRLPYAGGAGFVYAFTATPTGMDLARAPVPSFPFPGRL